MSSITGPQSPTSASGKSIVQSIKVAASQTGANFAYLLRTSGIESGFNPNAKAQASSATGLFQFTGQTWLRMIKSHGAEHGLGSYANQIQIAENGSAHVSDSALRQIILNLRNDPQIAAEMTGELGKLNGAILQKNVGGTIGPTELYLAHFLGAGGASSLLNALRANPGANAAAILPTAAQANPSVFFGRDGRPNSVESIYEHFARVFDQKSPTPAADTSTQILATAFEHSAPQSLTPVATGGLPKYVADSAPSVPGRVTPDDARSFAAIVLQQMNMAELTSALAPEDEDASAISVLV